MQNAVINLIRYAKANNAVVSVYDGGEWAVKKSNNERLIMEAVNSVDESQLIIRDSEGKKIGWALVVLGNDNDELVADCTCTEFMDAWNKHYNSNNKE